MIPFRKVNLWLILKNLQNNHFIGGKIFSHRNRDIKFPYNSFFENQV